MTGKQILLAGCGRMGGALLAAWLEHNVADSIRVVDPAGQPATDGRVVRHMQVTAVPEAFIPDIVVFAVKPQSLEAVLPQYGKRFGALPLYISIAAGKPVSYYAKHLRADARIVRAMPNTPALVGKGVTALVASSSARPQDRKTAETLFAATGSVVWLKDEKLMHAVTGLSGSGPAYVFYFLEALMHGGIEAGLDEATARRLALETVAGSAALAAHGDTPFSELRAQVTSPGGTTEAGLKALETASGLNFPQLVKKAVEQAVKKSVSLAGS